MLKYKILLVVLVATMCMPLSVKSDDFGMWGELNVEKKLSKKWNVGLGLEYRSRNNMKTCDRFSVGADVGYKVNDWLKVTVGYTLLDDHFYKENNKGTKYADYWGLRHRINVTFTLSHSFDKFNVSLRERWQYTYRQEKTVQRYYVNTTATHDAGEEADEHTYNGKGKNVWRNCLQLKYKVSSVWRPYVNAETYVAKGLDKIRYAAGTEIRLNKQHSLDVKYMYQHLYTDDDNEGNRHITGIGYTFKF